MAVVNTGDVGSLLVGLRRASKNRPGPARRP